MHKGEKKVVHQNNASQVNGDQCCTFWISGQLFGVDILDVREINADFSCTPIFHAPKEVKGYVNIRGQIYLILDISLMLGFETSESLKNRQLVIFKHSVGEPFGILVDKVGDVINITPDQIEENHHENKINTGEDNRILSHDLIKGVCKLTDKLLILLKSESLLESVGKLEE